MPIYNVDMNIGKVIMFSQSAQIDLKEKALANSFFVSGYSCQ